MKYCIKCSQVINENNKDAKWCMIITKKGQKIIEFECFHFECWKEFWDENVKLATKNFSKYEYL